MIPPLKPFLPIRYFIEVNKNAPRSQELPVRRKGKGFISAPVPVELLDFFPSRTSQTPTVQAPLPINNPLSSTKNATEVTARQWRRHNIPVCSPTFFFLGDPWAPDSMLFCLLFSSARAAPHGQSD